MKLQFPRLNNEEGFSMLQAVMLMGLMAMLATVYAQMNQSETRARRQSEVREDYVRVLTSVQSTAGQPSALRASSELVD